MLQNVTVGVVAFPMQFFLILWESAYKCVVVSLFGNLTPYVYVSVCYYYEHLCSKCCAWCCHGVGDAVEQAAWRGYSLRRRLNYALSFVQSASDVDLSLPNFDVDAFLNKASSLLITAAPSGLYNVTLWILANY